VSRQNENFSLSGRLKSMGHALDGIRTLLRDQHNAWIHALATVAVLSAGFYFYVSSTEWIALILAITIVWVAEALNTALEYLCDVVSPEFHPLVEKSKDIAAGAVLIAAMGAAAVGLIVFLPHVRSLL
jgi:diacylglycerol kinase (ATP)